MALQFKDLEGGAWKNLGSLPKIKKQLDLAEIRRVKGKEGKDFVLFIQPNGQYATAGYDSKNSPELKNAYLWEKPDGKLIVGLEAYERKELEVLDNL